MIACYDFVVVFLKQHSILDVIAGTALAIILYQIIYNDIFGKIKSVFAEKKTEEKTNA